MSATLVEMYRMYINLVFGFLNTGTRPNTLSLKADAEELKPLKADTLRGN